MAGTSGHRERKRDKGTANGRRVVPQWEEGLSVGYMRVVGFATEEITDKDGKVLFKKGDHLKTFAQLRDDGLTACGNWIYGGIYPEKGKNLAARRGKSKEGDYLAHEWGFVWPANRRILYNRASADPSGKPWSEKKKLIWWDAEASGHPNLHLRPPSL
jgi:hypothetical protein